MKKSLPTGKGVVSADLKIAFDVGHSSLGWAVLQAAPGGRPDDINLLGCGAVTFRADDCLASWRRAYRRQRRHIRATRQRIARLKALLFQLGVLSKTQLDAPGCAWPWLLAARTLRSAGQGKAKLLTWPELWDVLRWYAHNRGYDGNRKWANEIEAKPGADEEDDTEKVENARKLMKDFDTLSMCETVCAVSGLDPLGKNRSANVPPAERFKARNAAFPREVVEEEVRKILALHEGKVPKANAELTKALMADWRAIPCAAIKLPKRYSGGLLFGQLVPRFDNRIISKCPITDQKVPSRHTREFLNFRWAMQIANFRVSASTTGELRELDVPEREALDEAIRKTGAFTEKELIAAVREITGCKRDNLDMMFLHPDAKEALVVDPSQKKLTSAWGKLYDALPEGVRKHARMWLWRGKAVTLQKCLDEATRLKLPTAEFENALAQHLTAKNTKTSKKEGVLTREKVLNEAIMIKSLDQRAPYCRDLLIKAHEQVMSGKVHPKKEGGCLFITEEIRKKQLARPIDDQTNNHLVRHRLLILERLMVDIVKEYADGEKSRVGAITVEVNRDLRKFSGMTAKEKAQDMGQRLSNFNSVIKKLEAVIPREKITAGLIRKARVAEDLGWVCPYTEQSYDIQDLLNNAVDKDHIVPYALRPSNSLDSLVITFSDVNRLKKKRTALQFVTECASQKVEGRENLTITTPERFKKFVDGLESFKGHDDDKNRKKRRKELLRLDKYEEKEFTPGDLTQTSQLVRLAAQALKRHFQDQEVIPVSLPGSVTGAVRKAWRLTGCLAQANPQVLDAQGNVKEKSEIRDVTHLHHALDACVLGFASHFIPNNGRVWELLSKRNHNPAEQEELRALGIYQKGSDGKLMMTELHSRLADQIAKRLAEKRVVQHIPARMTGLRAEQNIWRVVAVKEGEATLTQTLRGPDQKRGQPKITTEKTIKLLGLFPEGGEGKLQKLKGALVIPDNFGVALDPEPQIIPFHKVPSRLAELRARNDGKPVRVIRNGQIINVATGRFQGVWRVFSVKNSAHGITIDLGRADIVRMQSKGDGMKREVQLKSLMKEGLSVEKVLFTGLNSCPTTSSALTPPNAP